MLIVEVQYPDLCFLRRYVVAPFELQHLDLYVLGLIADREIERESYLIRRVVSPRTHAHTYTHTHTLPSSEMTEISPKNGSLNRDLLNFLHRYGI